jgi:hypothetical protein
MNLPVRPFALNVPALFAHFPNADDVPAYDFVAPEAVPPPYHALLVHNHHMTVTVEAHHGDLVNVRILARRHDGDFYARKILLALQKTGKVVQFGIARVRLHYCSPQVRAEIVAGQIPLGRVLINHNVLRRIEPVAFLRVPLGPAQGKWFGLPEPAETYGRLGIIHCDGKPAVEVLEIVAPE